MYYNFTPPNEFTDEELVRLVQARNETAFTELVSRFSPRIWNMIIQNSRQRRDAEEILMDIWMAVWNNILGLRKPESFGGWLRRIAYTACNRYYASDTQRNREVLQNYEELAAQIDRDAVQRFQEARLREDAREAVYHLPEKVRSVGILYYLDLWSIKEIAEELNFAIGTVKTKLSEIRRLLRKEFKVESIQGETMSSNQERTKILQTKLKIIGIGGAGCNVVNQLMGSDLKNTEFYALDTDHDTLITCDGATQVQIGINTTQGRGTNSNLELGRSAAAENIDEFRSIVSDAKLAIVIAGMGGGTGTSVTPLLASIAREQDVLTVCFVTRPFNDEGEHRKANAEYGLRNLQSGALPRADAIIVVPNQRHIVSKDTELLIREVNEKSDEALNQGVKLIMDMVTFEGEISVNVDDIEEMLRDQGIVLMGIGKGKGENSPKFAAQNALCSPLLDGTKIEQATGMILNISTHPKCNMRSTQEAIDTMVDCVDGSVLFGMNKEDSFKEDDEILITFLATGLQKEQDNLISLKNNETTTGPDILASNNISGEFVHLHNHSEYTLLDGACRIPDMVRWAIENSSPAVALTDHGNMFGAWEFYKTAKAEGVNPIIGCEVYVENENSKTNGNGISESSHLTLLAENNEGYHNLLELTSLGYTQGFHRKPRINMEMLREYHSGIIALTGCINGIVPQFICSNQRDEAVRNLLTLKDIMGEDNLYVELQNHYIDKELVTYPVMVELANEYNLSVVGTNDCHYLRKSDHRMHDILLCIQTKKTVNDPDRMRFNNHFYFKNVEEMREALKKYPHEAIVNTLEIANRCNLKLDYDKTVMPKFKVAEGYTQDTYLKELCYEGLRKKYAGHLSEPILKQLEYELDVINKTGYADYFLIVADYVNYAIEQGYLLTARGSAASSLVLYGLGVINFNPMDYGCMFERFINLDRMNPPDIDIDFADHARDDVIDYIVRKYGHDSVGKVATFASFGAKGAIKDVGRVLEIPVERIGKLTDRIPNFTGIKLDDVLKSNTDFQLLAELPENRELIEISRAVEGIKRHVSTHASAIAISNGPLTDYVPLFKDRKGQIATQFESKTVEDVGIVKFDTLGISSLSEIADCINMVWENHNIKIGLEDIPLDHEVTYSLISQGLIAGLFQFGSSPGMYKVVTELKPDNFEEFSAIIALYRPAPMTKGDLQLFIDRKNGVQPIEYMHPSLENVLKKTYGICLYQEQIMQIACDVAGFRPGEAEILRFAFGRRDEVLAETQQPKFIEGALKNGISKDEAEQVYQYLKSMGQYAFTKSHTIAYSLLAYRMAYLKTHYPHEFMAAVMTGSASDTEAINRYRDECSKLSDYLKLEINSLPLDINSCEKNFTIEDHNIRFGLLAVEKISDEAIDSILTARNRDGLFTSLTDFRNRVDSNTVNEEVIENLVSSGAFDSLPE